MYTRYMQYSGFFEPEYEQPFTYAHQRLEFEEKQREAASAAAPPVPPIPEPPGVGGNRSEKKHESERKRSSRRETETGQERRRERASRRERESVSSRRRGHEKISRPLFGRLGLKGGIFDGLDLDTADILLILLLFYLYQESGDSEFLILLALLFLG